MSALNNNYKSQYHKNRPDRLWENVKKHLCLVDVAEEAMLRQHEVFYTTNLKPHKI